MRWTPRAAEDLEAIAEFIAADSRHFARLFVEDVLQAVERLGTFPKLGRTVPELMDPTIREILTGCYRIVYRIKPETIEVITLWHGSRLFDPSRIPPPEGRGSRKD